MHVSVLNIAVHMYEYTYDSCQNNIPSQWRIQGGGARGTIAPPSAKTTYRLAASIEIELNS